MMGTRHKPLLPLCLLPLYLVCCCLAATPESLSGNHEEDWISPIVDMMEMEYEDQCTQVAEADLSLLNGNKNALEEKLDAKKSFGDFAKDQVKEVRGVAADSPEIARKFELIGKPGDTLLNTDQWNNLVSYSEKAIYDIESFGGYDCQDAPQSCTYSMLLSTIAKSKDRHLLTSAKASWEARLPDEHKFEFDILPLARNASAAHGLATVEEYWEMLSEYENGYKKVEKLWEDLEPLYKELHKYLGDKLEKLNGSLRDDGSIPAHWLGSLFGNDWFNVIEVALPNQEIFREIDKNMRKKFIAGRNAYKQASALLVRLGIEPLKQTFWRDSKFDRACPAKLIHTCMQSTSTYIYACQNISLEQLLEAHEKIMSAKHAEIKAAQSTNTYIIREANRYSALDVALSELGSLLLLNPHQMDAEEVLPLKTSEQLDIMEPLQFIAALRDLPRLAYYMAADKWRLKLLENPGPIHIGTTWAETRRNLTKISPSDKDFLGDFNILTNKPYLSNFLGILLKYQLFNYFTDDIYEDNVDIVQHIAKRTNKQDTSKLKELMSKGFSQKWPDIVRNSLGIYDISADAMIDYFRPLMDFISTRNSETSKTSIEEGNDDEDDEDGVNYEDEEENEEVEKAKEEENVGNTLKEDSPAVLQEISKKTHDKLEESAVKEINNNNLDSVNENYDDNPHLIPKDEGSPAASSSEISTQESDASHAPQKSQMPYVWIALGILALIIVILAVVIGRKRYKHKKELERERREGAA